jgi:hypothetical protein
MSWLQNDRKGRCDPMGKSMDRSALNSGNGKLQIYLPIGYFNQFQKARPEETKKAAQATFKVFRDLAGNNYS